MEKHFGKLLGQPAINTAPSSTRAIIGHILSINTNNFTMEELRQTIKQILTIKACGPDSIPADMYVCVSVPPFTVNVSSAWISCTTREQINNVVLKTLFSYAKSLHCYFRMRDLTFLNSHFILFTH